MKLRNKVLKFRSRALMTTAIALPFALNLFAMPGQAATLPTGGSVVAGSATISSSGNTTTINQSTNRAIINWSSFDISSDGTVQVNQPGASSLEVERVVGSTTGTQIAGALNSNGQVMILNPNGVAITKSGSVNVNSLVVSTGTIDDAQVMSGAQQIQLTGMGSATTGAVTNAGTITVADSGLVALVGAQVANNGTINARLGRVELAGGTAATLDFNGDGLITIDTAGDLASGTMVDNSGTINAEGGIVQMSASAAKNTLDNIINMDGIITANATTQNQAGQVILAATGEGKVTIGANDGSNAGSIDVNNSSGGQGGSISITGNQININPTANLNASGATGGGTITVTANNYANGNSTVEDDINIASGAILNANATTSGSGGTITLDSTGTLEANGTFDARGFSTTNAGSVLLEADTNFTSFGGTADLSGEAAGALTGNLTLQSASLSVGTNSGDTLSASTLENELNLANVEFKAGAINFDAGDNVSSSSANDLILTSYHPASPTTDGSLSVASDVSVQNLVLRSNDPANIDVSGSGQLQAANLTLDAPLVFPNTNQNPLQQASTVTVGSAFGQQGTVQQAIDWVQTNGQVFIDGVFDQAATIAKAVTLAGASADAFVQTLTINDPGVTVTADGSGNPTVHAATVNLGADNPTTNLLQTAYDMVAGSVSAFGKTLNLAQGWYNDILDANADSVTINGAPSGTIINQVALDSTTNTFNNVQSYVLYANATAALQQAYELTDPGFYLILTGTGYTNLDVDKSGINIYGEAKTLSGTLTLNSANNNIYYLNANTVQDNVATAEQGYSLTAPNGTLNLAQGWYNETVNANTPGVTINGAPGGTIIASMDLNTANNTYNNLQSYVVYDYADTAQNAYNLTAPGFYLGLLGSGYTNLDANKSGITIFGNQDLSGTLTLNQANNNFYAIWANTVQNNVASAQQGYDVTYWGGTLNLTQNSYGDLDANKTAVKVNGAAGGSALNSLTLDAMYNNFNNITTPAVTANVVGTSQQAIDLVNTGGAVNFGFTSSPENITVDRAITLNGDTTAPSSGTTFGAITLDTLTATFDNIFGNTVNDNTAKATPGMDITAENGTLNLAQEIYVPENLNIPYAMTVNGASPFSVFETVTDNFGATLNRIYELQAPGASAQGLTLVISNPDGELAQGKTSSAIESFLSSLAPAGPGAKDANNITLCTAKGTSAADECAAEALADGHTVVMFDITNNQFNLVAENESGALVQTRQINADELGHILDGSEAI